MLYHLVVCVKHNVFDWRSSIHWQHSLAALLQSISPSSSSSSSTLVWFNQPLGISSCRVLVTEHLPASRHALR